MSRFLQPAVGAMPPGLTSDAARFKWTELYPLITGKGFVGPQYMDMLALYCESYASWLEAVERIRATSFLVKQAGGAKGGGKITVTPWVQVRDLAAQRMYEIGRALGFAPDHDVAAKMPTFDEFTADFVMIDEEDLALLEAEQPGGAP